VLEVRQHSGREKWRRNDRLFAVATHAPAHKHLRTLADLGPQRIEEVESLFVHYAGFNGKTLEVLGRGGPSRAERLLKDGARRFGRKP
jgi:inorganic pyrophosphatase